MKNKSVLVYGLARSGKASVDLLKHKGAFIYTYDDLNRFCEGGVSLKTLSEIKKIDYCILSPGVDVSSPKVQTLIDNKVKVISELQLGLNYLKGKLFCITGTNGKTTTCNLLHQVFLQANKKTNLCGNVGTPVSEICLNTKKNMLNVCEVSSFQMETTGFIKSFASVILNVKPDHLDRHKSFGEYVYLKEKVIKKSKFKVFNLDDEVSFSLSKKYKDSILFSKHTKTNGAYVDGGKIYYKNEYILNIKDISLYGEKNLENVLAVVTLAKLAKIKNKHIAEAIKNFKALKHRLEPVCNKNGVLYINDSKSTNVASTICALEAFKKSNIILLVGGRGKSINYSPIFKYQLKACVCFGECGEELFKIAKANSIYYKTNLKEATLKAKEIAENGDVVLLSPACSSFDEYENYKKRGEHFAKIVTKDGDNEI